MSYASAAAEAPAGDSGKIPSPPEVETTSNPKGSVAIEKDLEKAKDTALGGKAHIEQKVKDVKKDLPKLGEDFKKAKKEATDKLQKEYDENKGPVINFFKAIGTKISEATSYVINTSYSASATAKEELKNPVVATQTVVGIGAVAGLITGIQERSRIFGNKTDGEITAILAALVGLVALDGYVFKTLYPKYDKKPLK